MSTTTPPRKSPTSLADIKAGISQELKAHQARVCQLQGASNTILVNMTVASVAFMFASAAVSDGTAAAARTSHYLFGAGMAALLTCMGMGWRIEKQVRLANCTRPVWTNLYHRSRELPSPWADNYFEHDAQLCSDYRHAKKHYSFVGKLAMQPTDDDNK